MILEGIIKNLNATDDMGNKLICKPDGTIILDLISQSRERNLGRIYKTAGDGIVYRKKVKEKNIYRELEAWGINSEIWRVLPPEAALIFESDKKTYIIQKHEAEPVKPKYRWYKAQGFERQVFIPLSQWG